MGRTLHNSRQSFGGELQDLERKQCGEMADRPLQSTETLQGGRVQSTEPKISESEGSTKITSEKSRGLYQWRHHVQ